MSTKRACIKHLQVRNACSINVSKKFMKEENSGINRNLVVTQIEMSRVMRVGKYCE